MNDLVEQKIDTENAIDRAGLGEAGRKIFHGRSAGMTLSQCAAEARLAHPTQASRLFAKADKAVKEAAAERNASSRALNASTPRAA